MEDKDNKVEVLVGHIYYVYFDPTRHGEFNSKHLACVLKANDKLVTYIVIPLTSQWKEGDESHKISLGNLGECLPTNLRMYDTYAVLDQIRTVSHSRFMDLLDNNTKFISVMPEDKLKLIYVNAIAYLLNDTSDAKEILSEVFGRLDNI